MNQIVLILPYAQIVLAVLLVVAILLQRTSASLGGAFGGGDNFSSAFHTRRGFEKTLFVASIAIAVLFVISAFLALILK